MKQVVHVPHASTWVPDAVHPQFGISSAELGDEAIESADLYTDQLARESWPGAEIIKAEVSRVVLDVERYPDDAQEVMAASGRGMIYTRTHDGRDLRRRVSREARNDLQQRYYDPHWARLRAAAANGVLIDLHTYPQVAWSVEPDATADRPEFDLGTTEGITPSGWIVNLTRHFERAGFTVGINTPYAGVIDAGASYAIMLEIRRDVLGTPHDLTKWKRMVRALSKMPLPR